MRGIVVVESNYVSPGETAARAVIPVFDGQVHLSVVGDTTQLIGLRRRSEGDRGCGIVVRGNR